MKKKKQKKKVFLSHSGVDKKYAIEIAKRVSEFLNSTPFFEIEVFNTSDQQFRFKEIKTVLLPGEYLREQYSRWENDLRIYLQSHLLESDIYLLLVTKRSLLENSDWVLFEMEMAEEEAKKRKTPFFFPCLYNGASFEELPKKSKFFQAANINSELGFHKLLNQLRHLFEKDA